MRKLELPPKFASALTSAHPGLVHQPSQPSPLEPQTLSMPEPVLSSSNGMGLCSKPLSTSVPAQAPPVRPQPPQLVHQLQTTISPPAIQRPIVTPTAVALPVASYNTLPQTQTFAIANPGPLQTPGPPQGIPATQSETQINIFILQGQFRNYVTVSSESLV